MFKPIDIKFADLPLERVGSEKDTGAEVYRLTGDLNANIHLSFSKYGLRRKSETILVGGEVVSNSWLRYA